MSLFDFLRPKMVSPIPEPEREAGFVEKLLQSLFPAKTYEYSSPQPTPTPTPTPIPQPELEYRNPLVEQWANNISAGKYAQMNQNPLKLDELISGIDIASDQYGVPRDLLTDIAGLESMLGYYDRPINSYPGQYDDEKNARGPFMFLLSTALGEGLESDDRYSATQSAKATARKLKKGQLGEWDVIDKQGGGNGRLTDWYSEEELAPYLTNSKKSRGRLVGYR